MHRAFEQGASFVFQGGVAVARFSSGYPPCYPSPVLIASSNASSPHSSSLQAFLPLALGAPGQLVLVRNCSSALWLWALLKVVLAGAPLQQWVS